MRRILVAAGLILVLAGVAALVFLGSNLNGLVAKLIEEQGSAVTGSAVSVSGVDISRREARGTIDGLRIASPAGFGGEPAFALGNITLPAIRLENLGGTQGATPDAIAKQVIGALVKQATESIARSEVKGLIEQQLGRSLGDKAKGLLEKLR